MQPHTQKSNPGPPLHSKPQGMRSSIERSIYILGTSTVWSFTFLFEYLSKQHLWCSCSVTARKAKKSKELTFWSDINHVKNTHKIPLETLYHNYNTNTTLLFFAWKIKHHVAQKNNFWPSWECFAQGSPGPPCSSLEAADQKDVGQKNVWIAPNKRLKGFWFIFVFLFQDPLHFWA